MEELIDAIATTFAANGTLVATCAGNLWFEEAAQVPTYPYGVFFINNVIPTASLPATTETNQREEYMTQFSFWDDDVDRSDMMTIESEMKSTFDYQAMTVSVHTNWSTRPMGSRIMRVKEAKRWHLVMEYSIQLQKT